MSGDLENAPPPVAVAGLVAVPMDIHQVVATLTFDAAAQVATAQAAVQRNLTVVDVLPDATVLVSFRASNWPRKDAFEGTLEAAWQGAEGSRRTTGRAGG